VFLWQTWRAKGEPPTWWSPIKRYTHCRYLCLSVGPSFTCADWQIVSDYGGSYERGAQECVEMCLASADVTSIPGSCFPKYVMMTSLMCCVLLQARPWAPATSWATRSTRGPVWRARWSSGGFYHAHACAHSLSRELHTSNPYTREVEVHLFTVYKPGLFPPQFDPFYLHVCVCVCVCVCVFECVCGWSRARRSKNVQHIVLCPADCPRLMKPFQAGKCMTQIVSPIIPLCCPRCCLLLLLTVCNASRRTWGGT
jgi:hypothetical protein